MNTFFKAACVAGAALLFAAGSAAAGAMGGHTGGGRIGGGHIGGGHIGGGHSGGFRMSPGPSIRMSPGSSIRMSPGVPRMGFRANGGMPRIHSGGIRSGGFRAGPRLIQANPGVVHVPRGIKHAYVPTPSHRPHIGKFDGNKHHGRHHHRRHGRIFLYAARHTITTTIMLRRLCGRRLRLALAALSGDRPQQMEIPLLPVH